MQRRAVGALTAAAALGVAIFFTLYSLIPVTRADDPALSSLFVGVMMACVMAVQAFTPALVRRFSLRLVVAVSLAVLAAGALVTGIAQGTVALLVGAVLSGAAFGILIVAGAQGVALLVPPTHLGRALGAYGLVTMAATAVGSPAGVQLALSFSEASACAPPWPVCAAPASRCDCRAGSARRRRSPPRCRDRDALVASGGSWRARRGPPSPSCSSRSSSSRTG